jgi:hypothetical protein
MSTDNTSDPHPGRREALIKLGKYAAYATPVVTDEELLTPTVSDEALEAASNQRLVAESVSHIVSYQCNFCPPSPAVSRDG